MIRDYLVAFDGFEFECVDKGFEDNEEIEVVLRPEDLDIVDPGQAKIRGIVRNITFKGVHYEILIETELRTYMVHTADYAEVGREVGLKFGLKTSMLCVRWEATDETVQKSYQTISCVGICGHCHPADTDRIICIYRRRKRGADVLLYPGEFPQIPGSYVYERYFQVL